MQQEHTSVSGTALLQLGAPADAPSVEGILITINPTGNGPLISKIEGAFSAVLRAAVNLWTVKFQRQMQWDIARFVVDRNSEPSFELVPVNITYTVINAANTPQQKFLGKQDVLIDKFYSAGSIQVTDGTKPMLVFTGTDPATGKMTIMASLRPGTAWGAPVNIASAGGVISLVARENLAGGWVVAWSEIDASDVGNPYPISTIKYAVSDATGATWSAPKELTSNLDAMFDLKLVSAGDTLVLTYLSTAEGPRGENRSLFSTLWDGTKWSTPELRIPSQPIQTYDSAGNSLDGSLLTAATGKGGLLSLRWDGRTWTAPQSIATNARGAISLRFSNADVAVLAWENSQGSIAFSMYDAIFGEWTHLSIPIQDASPDDCQVLPLNVNGQTLYLLAWSEGGENTAIWYAYLDAQGRIKQDRTQATLTSTGIFKKLQLRPVKGYRAALVAQYSTLTNDLIQEINIGLSTPGDCDGDGVSDADAIALEEAPDCDHNGIPDVCDIRNGTSQDLNHNGIPDECEPAPFDDCNRNGISDVYELSFGIGDENGNGMLDYCEAGLGTKTVPVPASVRARFYRASHIVIKTRQLDSITFQYQGTLEQADKVTGPWTAVP